MRSRSTPTIIDVARAAGVSKSLVSLAVRGEPGVSTESRTRILKIAEDLGYRSNRWASSLVRGRSQLIGVLLTDLRSAYHTDVVIGVEDAAAEQGLETVVSHGRRDPGTLAARLDSLVRLGVDAVVVVSAHAPMSALAQAAESVPVVVVGRPRRLPATVSRVCNDDEAGARLAVEHLIAQGHERIAYLQASESAAALARRDAYRKVLEEHALPTTVLSDPADLSVSEDEPVTAVFASTDLGAGAVLGWAYDAGCRVPEDLAVVGYDDTDLAVTLRPTLTSVAQPRLAMGRRALEIVSGEEIVREVFPPTLVVRRSSTP